jgi:SagB-type dehydrogenase family enzyme
MSTLRDVSRRRFLGIATVLGGALLGGLLSFERSTPADALEMVATRDGSTRPGSPALAEEAIQLPSPRHHGPSSLEETLSKRRSIRTYTEASLKQEDISQLLWAAQGITDSSGKRTAPSAGALYPLEIYLVTGEGSYHYQPEQHSLLVKSQEDKRSALYQAASRQQAVLHAPAVFVVTAVYARTITKYGPERSPRCVHMEAGHAAQNLLLQAVSLGLAGVPMAGFDDKQVQKVLSLPEDHAPLYLIPVGHSRP